MSGDEFLPTECHADRDGYCDWDECPQRVGTGDECRLTDPPKTDPRLPERRSGKDRREPPAAVQAGDVREALAAIALADAEVTRAHTAQWEGKETAWRITIPADTRRDTDIIIGDALNKARIALEAKASALTALVEAARMYSDRLEHGKYCDSHHRPYVATTTPPPKCDCGYDALRATLAPFLDSAGILGRMR